MYLNPRKAITILVLFTFWANSIVPLPAHAQDFRLPAPGVMVGLSPEFNPPILKGIKVHPDNPFRFDFILDKGDSELSNAQIKDESSRLIKYFLASLTIPEKDLWVNLSPYEKNRIVPESFGQTEMGRDLLAEDYMLKQITASLIYPEGQTGKRFWKRIYEQAAKKFGTTNIPVNTFNKVWIVPEKAVVYENAKAGTAYVVESRLKVMLEQDYLSLTKHEGITAPVQGQETNQLGSQIVREIVIPELTKEVNEGKNFTQLRQVYNSLILATWYKKKIKDSILEQVYADKKKVAGVNIDDPKETQRIYQRYLQAFKKGVYNYIKDEVDPATQEAIPRKYFSGGFTAKPLFDANGAMTTIETIDPAMLKEGKSHNIEVSTQLDQAMAVQIQSTQERYGDPNFITEVFRKSLTMQLSQQGVSIEKAQDIISRELNSLYSSGAKVLPDGLLQPGFARLTSDEFIQNTAAHVPNFILEDGLTYIRTEKPWNPHLFLSHLSESYAIGRVGKKYRFYSAIVVADVPADKVQLYRLYSINDYYPPASLRLVKQAGNIFFVPDELQQIAKIAERWPRPKINEETFKKYSQLAILHEIAEILWRIIPITYEKEWHLLSMRLPRNSAVYFRNKLRISALSISQDFQQETFADRLAYFWDPKGFLYEIGEPGVTDDESKFFKEVLDYFKQKKDRGENIFDLTSDEMLEHGFKPFSSEGPDETVAAENVMSVKRAPNAARTGEGGKESRDRAMNTQMTKDVTNDLTTSMARRQKDGWSSYPQLDGKQERERRIIAAMESLNGLASAEELADAMKIEADTLAKRISIVRIYFKQVDWDKINDERVAQNKFPIYPKLIHAGSKRVWNRIMRHLEQRGGISTTTEIMLDLDVTQPTVSEVLKNIDFNYINKVRANKHLFPLEVFYNRQHGVARFQKSVKFLNDGLAGLTKRSGFYEILTDYRKYYVKKFQYNGYRSFRFITAPYLFELYKTSNGGLLKKDIFFQRLIEVILDNVPTTKQSKRISKNLPIPQADLFNYYFQVQVRRALNISSEAIRNYDLEGFRKNLRRVINEEFPLVDSIYPADSAMAIALNPKKDRVMDNIISLPKQQKTGPGGIDLTPANMNLQTQNPGSEIKFHMNAAMLQQLQNAPGFMPVIINIQPMTNLRAFLGIPNNEPQSNQIALPS